MALDSYRLEIEILNLASIFLIWGLTFEKKLSPSMRAPNAFLSDEAKQKPSETADQAFFSTGLIPAFLFF